MFNLNRKERRNKKANKVAKWIVDTILKLPTDDLVKFYSLIGDELLKRSEKNV